MYDKDLDIRLFGGTFIYKNSQLSPVYDFRLSGTEGTNDYTYDHLFFGRFENPASKNVLGSQFVRNEGGFAIYSPFGQTNDWLLAVNLNSSLPFPKKELIQLYANAAFVGNSETVTGYHSDNFYYEAGAKLILVKDDIEVYFPIIMSKNIWDYSNDIHDNYLQKIRFVINLKGFNFFEVFRNQKNL